MRNSYQFMVHFLEEDDYIVVPAEDMREYFKTHKNHRLYYHHYSPYTKWMILDKNSGEVLARVWYA